MTGFLFITTTCQQKRLKDVQQQIFLRWKYRILSRSLNTINTDWKKYKTTYSTLMFARHCSLLKQGRWVCLVHQMILRTSASCCFVGLGHLRISEMSMMLYCDSLHFNAYDRCRLVSIIHSHVIKYFHLSVFVCLSYFTCAVNKTYIHIYLTYILFDNR